MKSGLRAILGSVQNYKSFRLNKSFKLNKSLDFKTGNNI